MSPVALRAQTLIRCSGRVISALRAFQTMWGVQGNSVGTCPERAVVIPRQEGFVDSPSHGRSLVSGETPRPGLDEPPGPTGPESQRGRPPSPLVSTERHILTPRGILVTNSAYKPARPTFGQCLPLVLRHPGSGSEEETCAETVPATPSLWLGQAVPLGRRSLPRRTDDSPHDQVVVRKR
jgi:hypothetical protein